MTHNDSVEKVEINEIFSSIQGEGPYVGCRQAFVRFANCNLDCSYCDTPKNNSPQYCNLEKIEGTEEMKRIKNPFQPHQLNRLINANFASSYHHSISLTGGEPLLYAEFLERVIPLLKKNNWRVYLETNGTLPGNLEKIINHVDFIAMDIKLPSTTGLNTLWELHKSFFDIAKLKTTFVKIIVNNKTSYKEIDEVINIIKSEKTPLIIQPVTNSPHGVFLPDKISPKNLLDLQYRALNFLKNVRVIPQTHKIMGHL